MIEDVLSEWIRLYVEEKYTMKAIAQKSGVNYQTVRNYLMKSGVKISSKGRFSWSVASRQKMSVARIGCPGFWKGKKMPKESLYKNMLNHIRWNVDLAFLLQFEDVEKLKYLNRMLTRDRVSINFDTAKYKQFIEKFYYDKSFDRQWKIFQESGNKYDKPSLDHIVPLSRGGTWDLDNLQIISWFDNRAKVDMTQEEYDAIRRKYWNI